MAQKGPNWVKIAQKGPNRVKMAQQKKERTRSNLTSTSTGKTSLSLDWSLMVGILRAGGDLWDCSEEKLNVVYCILRPLAFASAHLSSFQAMMVIYKCSGFKSSSGWNITYRVVFLTGPP